MAIEVTKEVTVTETIIISISGTDIINILKEKG